MDALPDLPLPDPSLPAQRHRVRGLFRRAAWRDPDLEGALVAGAEGLREALDWTVRGTAADETACVWLENLRWARALGLDPEEGAPVPPVAWWETALEAVPRGWAGRHPGLAEQLRAAQMQYPARHREPVLADAAFFPRLAPLAVYPQASASHLGQLAVNLTALTHAAPEALACAVVWTLLARWRVCPGPDDHTGVREPAGDPGPAGNHGPAAGLARLRHAVGLREDAPASEGRDPGAADASSGLVAAMAATGSSWDRVAGLVRSAPHTVRALRDPQGLVARPGDAPGCVVFLAGELLGDPHGILAAPGVLTEDEDEPESRAGSPVAEGTVGRIASAWLVSLEAWQEVWGRHGAGQQFRAEPQ